MNVGRFRAATLAIVLILAGCSGATETSDASSGADDREWQSPLADYMGVDLGFDFDDEAAMEAKQLEVNERVTACMAAEGFEWKPNPEEMMMVSGPPVDEEGLEWGSDEWTAKYGFGISTMAFPQETVGPDLVGSSESFMFEEEAHVDPNQDYLNTLSEAEVEKFYATLYGDDPGPDIDFEAMTEEEINAAMEEYYSDFVPTGCMNEAQEDIMGFGGNDYWMEFQDELQDMYEQIEKDPRVAAFEQEISQCVSDKGQTYTNMQSVYEDLEERMSPLYNEAYNQGPGGDIEMPSDEEMAEMSEAQMQELFAPKLSDESKAELAEIQADEIALAIAVRDCGGNDEDRASVYQEVTIEYEERFIEENRAALDAYLAEQDAEGGADSDADSGDSGGDE